MTNNEKSDSTALVKAKTSAVAKGDSPLVGCGLEDLIRLTGQTVPQAAGHRVVTILYAAADQVMDQAFHECATEALASSCDIVPVWESNEREIRLLWKQRNVDCAILVLNNIHLNNVVGAERHNTRELFRNALALIRWLRNNGTATIIAFSGLKQPGLQEEAGRNGADGFFYLPFQPRDLEQLLQDRFAPRNSVTELPGRCVP